MASQTIFHPTPPSSSATRLCGWWSRPIATYPAANDRQATFKESAAYFSPIWGGIFTIVAIFIILPLIIDKAHSHAKISIQNIAVSSAAWKIDFLVKDPSSRYPIYYDDGDAAVRLGHLNAAVLNITRKRDSRDHAAFSLAFVAEQGNRSDVVSGELDITLRARHKRYYVGYVGSDDAGHFHIRCKNLTRSREKIICQSSFTHLKRFEFGIDRTGQGIMVLS